MFLPETTERASEPPVSASEMVLLCARAEVDGHADDRVRVLLRDKRVDWDDFWSVAAQQEVQPLVSRTLTRPDVAGFLPEHAAAAARAVRLQTVGYNMAVHAELQRLGRGLRGAEIAVVPLKGTHLAQRLFGTLEARRVGDIDILVQVQQLEAARNVLRRLGYSPMEGVSHGIEAHEFHGVPWVRSATSVTFVVELHWGLSDPRFVSIDYDALWKRVLARADADAQAHGRGDLYPLPAEETLLFLALHLPKHDAGVLRLLADIDRLIRLEGPTMDWLYVLATAERWHLRWLLYFALQRSEQLLGTPVPRWVMQRVEPPAWRRGAVAILAGPEAILRPPAPEHMRVHRFRLAYCAMLSPVGRALSAYAHYLFTPYRFRRPGPLWKVMSGLEGLGRGLTWTVLVAANCLGEQRLPWQRRAQARVGSA